MDIVVVSSEEDVCAANTRFVRGRVNEREFKVDVGCGFGHPTSVSNTSYCLGSSDVRVNEIEIPVYDSYRELLKAAYAADLIPSIPC